MKTLILTLSLVVCGTAFGADLQYDCKGLWAAGGGVFEDTATIHGVFTPDLNKGTIELSIPARGGKFNGTFEGEGPMSSTGNLILVSLPGNHSDNFSMSRLGPVDGVGFDIEGADYRTILSCTLVK